MRYIRNRNWLQRRTDKLKMLKLWQQHRHVVGELPTLRVQGGAVKRRRELLNWWQVWKKPSYLRRATKKDFEHSGTFQEAIKPVLVMAQLFSLMPVRGVTAKTASGLSFSWCYIRTIYSMLVIVCFGISGGFTTAFAFRATLNFDSVEIIIFYTSIFLIAIAFFHLAKHWPALMMLWQDIETKLPPLRTLQQKAALAQRIKMITLIATMCSLAEHLLSMLSIIYYVNACPVFEGKPIESFLFSSFYQIFYFVEYRPWLGFTSKIVNVLSTFAWSFNDIFVMSVSVALSAHFRHLNDCMENAVKRPTTELFWIQCRVNYRNLCKLCAAVDDAISAITFLCFSNNLYFICGKILKSLQKKPSIAHSMYFWYSLGYLLARTFVLSLFAAEINDESKRPLNIFRRISRDSWCSELKRFSEEVSSDVVALSGLKFFHLTRRLVLSVAGTIVTYELVLLQFNKQDRVFDCYEN